MPLYGSLGTAGAAATNIGYTPVNKAGDTMGGALGLQSLLVPSGIKKIRQWTGNSNGNIANGAVIDFFGNTTQYVDLHFILIIQGYHSYRSWTMVSGSVGGYGLGITTTGTQTGAVSMSVAYVSDGYGKLRFTNTSSYTGSFYYSAIILGDSPVTAYSGTLYE